MRSFLRNGKLLTLMLGHLTVDTYAGVIPVLYPVLIGTFKLSLATVGLVSLAYSGMAAVSQPLFGFLADRFGTRFTGPALGWTALTFSLVGFVTSFPLLLLLAFASGLGSGAFHPMGALDVRALLPAWRRSFGMSVYVTAGTVGVAIGPLIGILVFGAFGIHGTGLLIIPGLINAHTHSYGNVLRGTENSLPLEPWALYTVAYGRSLDDEAIRVVAEGHVVEGDLAVDRRKLDRIGGLPNLGLGVDQVAQLGHRGLALLVDVVLLHQELDGLEEAVEVQEERHQGPDGQRAVKHHPTTHGQQHRLAEHTEQLGAGRVGRADVGGHL